MGVAVLVLGDIGRSPRMQYHAQELAGASINVDLVGFTDSLLPPSLADNKRVRVFSIPSCTSSSCKFLPYPLWAPIKVILQTFWLLWVLLFSISRPSHLLVQNPPAIPTLFVAQLVCKLRGVKLVIDWHNLAYTILALRTGTNSPMVRLAKSLEKFLGRHAHCHFFVTEALCNQLSRDWGISGRKVVLYDQPQARFTRLCDESRLEFLHTKLQYQFPCAAEFRPGVDFMIVSSTSWTADEDFDMLLDALSHVEQALLQGPTPGTTRPAMLYAVVTGKGPLRASFETRSRRAGFLRTVVLTGWLRAEDYPRILGSADLGISLHSSSSGLDLPMKVVDMFGCGLPVCALNYKCLHELVTDSVGMTFASARELADQILDLMQNRKKLEKMRAKVLEKYQECRWPAEWRQKALANFV